MTTFTFFTFKVDLQPGSYNGVPEIATAPANAPQAIAITTETIDYTVEANGSLAPLLLKYSVTSPNGPTAMDAIEWDSYPYAATTFQDGSSGHNLDTFLSDVSWELNGISQTSTLLIHSDFVRNTLYFTSLAGDSITPAMLTLTKFQSFYTSINGFASTLGDFGPDQSLDANSTSGMTVTDNDVLYGSNNSDNLSASIGDDTLYGFDGADVLKGGAGDDILNGGKQGDSLYGGTGSNEIYGGQSKNDFTNYSSHGAAVVVQLATGRGAIGSASSVDMSDNLYGIEGAFGSAFDDTLTGADNDNFIDGWEGDDVINGKKGEDTLLGGDGSDEIDGGNGNDSVIGGKGADNIVGGLGDDYLKGGNGKDEITGGYGDDDIFGEAGADTIQANAGNDTVSGGNGGDTIRGGDGSDVIDGNKGNDDIRGQKDSDTLSGDEGADKLDGGKGDDVVTGGADADMFVYNKYKHSNRDVFTDFEVGVDQIDVSDFGLSTAELSEIIQFTVYSSSDAALVFDADNVLTLNNIQDGDLDISDFVY